VTENLQGFAEVPAELPEVRILRVQPGDMLVLRHEKMIDAETAAWIRSHMEKQFPDNPCMILDGGITLDAVLRKEGD
jgi:hypothetical protein